MSSLAQKLGTATVTVLVTTMIAVNVFSGAVSGIWLAIKGEWVLIGLGLLMSFVMPWIYALLSLPSMGLALLAGKAIEKGYRFITALLSFIGALYTDFIIVGWVYNVFYVFLSNNRDGLTIPLIVWCYSTTMSPLSYMASKESDENTGSSIAFFLAQLSYMTLAIMWLFEASTVSMVGVLLLFVLIFALGSVILSNKQRR